VAALWHRLPVDHWAEDGAVALGDLEPFGELAAATAGDVDRDQALAVFVGDEGGDAAAVGGEDRGRLRVVGQLAQLVGAGVADPLRPESLVAAEEEQVPIWGDVFHVGRARPPPFGRTE